MRTSTNTVLFYGNEQDVSRVVFRDAGYTVKTISTGEERVQVFRLRHRVFCQELGWVTKSVESDNYDRSAVFFGVFNDNDDLTAFIRLIPAPHPFMLDKEFSFLIDSCTALRRGPGTGEISRLCVAPEHRGAIVRCDFGDTILAMFIFKGLYIWCLEQGIPYLYAVTEPKTQRLFVRRGIPLRQLGESRAMPDAVTAMAVTLDWDEFVEMNNEKRPDLLKWFNQVRSTSAQVRPQPPGLLTPNQASPSHCGYGT